MKSEPVVTDSEDDIDLLELGAVLWGRKWLVAAITAVFVVAGLGYYVLAPRIYEADALLQVEPKNNDLALSASMQALLPSQSPQIATETQIIRSRMILDQVVRELHLNWIAQPLRLPIVGDAAQRLDLPRPPFDFLRAYAWHVEAIRLGKLAMARPFIGRPLTLTALGGGRFRVLWPDGTTQQGVIEKTVVHPGNGSQLRVAELTGAPGRKFTVVETAVPDVVQGLSGAVGASEAGRQSDLIRTTLSDRNPGRAVEILDAVSNAYVDQNIARSSAEASKSLKFVENQLPKAKAQISVAQTALNAYQEKKDSVDLTLQTQALLGQQTDIEAQLNALALKADELRQNYTVNHPIFQMLLSKRRQLEKQLAAVKKQTAALPATQKEIFDLQRNLEVAQKNYLQLIGRAQDLKVLKASSIGNVRVIDTAQASLAPVSPRGRVILGISLLLGLIAGAGYVLLRYALRRGVRGAEDIEKAGLPVFATVGYSAAAVGLDKRRGNLPILALEHPDDVVVEALRSLRTSLHFGLLDAKTNSVLMTSAAPGAGKSFSSVNLAVISAQAGQRVCLIDADLSRGYLRRFFGVERNRKGLAEFLAGHATLEEIIMPGPVEGLSFITTGQMPPNPSELLMRPAFGELLRQLDARCDLTLLDAPPTLAVTDPVIMARRAGATIMVVRHAQTTPEEIEAVRKSFEHGGARLAGAVLNGYRAQPGEYRRGSYHYNTRYSYRSSDRG